MTEEVSPEVAQDRLERLQSQQKRQTLAYHETRVGQEALVFVDGASRRGGNQVSGRDPQHRVVNVDLAPGQRVEPGTRLAVRIVEATPHSLLGEALDPTRLDPGNGDFTGSRLTSAGETADESERVDRARGSAEDALRVV